MNQLGEKYNIIYTDPSDDQRFAPVSCSSATPKDLNNTRLASQILFACGSGVFYLVILTFSICGVCFRNFARLSSSRGTFFVFFIGALVASINVFTNSDNLDAKLYFRCSLVFLVGMVYILFGALLFFQSREEGANEQALGGQQPFMGAFVGFLTFPLFVLELVFCLLALGGPNSDSDRHSLTILHTILYLLQKPVQLAIYLCLRRKIPREVYRENAQFYFRIISFFNLIEWLDSQVNENADFLLSGINDTSMSCVWPVIYKALIIDYRLLCCLLFLEHSLEIEVIQNQQGDDRGRRNVRDRGGFKKCSGIFAGFMCLIAPILCGLYSAHKGNIGASAQVSAMLVQIAIIISGSYLLLNNNLEAGENNRESSAVKIMVCCFGALGFLCWITQAVIAGHWAATAHDRKDIRDLDYVAWHSGKFVVRGISTAFLMYLFTMVNAQAFPQQNRDMENNDFVVPFIMLGVLSTFIETLVDQYVGAIDSTIRCEITDQSLKILLEAGLPMYLGFLVHVFLHFFSIAIELG
ncbi:uncharacterized protein LOC141880642 [Acropora palmata]|uniref:uncharacterized protein LOC141880642 n=1 Tax=Acropora palmata TaxID=6131 RepID=UPI003DA1ABF2